MQFLKRILRTPLDRMDLEVYYIKFVGILSKMTLNILFKVISMEQNYLNSFLAPS